MSTRACNDAGYLHTFKFCLVLRIDNIKVRACGFLTSRQHDVVNLKMQVTYLSGIPSTIQILIVLVVIWKVPGLTDQRHVIRISNLLFFLEFVAAVLHNEELVDMPNKHQCGLGGSEKV